MTREVITGLVANIETREQRRKDYAERMLRPEHPCASSTDDVEGIMSLFHEMLGAVFDMKEFFDEFPKILNEFAKRMTLTALSIIGQAAILVFKTFPFRHSISLDIATLRGIVKKR